MKLDNTQELTFDDMKLTKVVFGGTGDTKSGNEYFDSVGNGSSGFEESDAHHAYWSNTFYKQNQKGYKQFGGRYCPTGNIYDSLGWEEEQKKKIQQATNLILHTKNGVKIRLHITDATWIDHPLFQNKFCQFFYSLSEEQSVDILVGNSIYGTNTVCTLGGIMDALNTTRGNVTMHMCGRGGMCESCLWLNTQNKRITPYGSLCFSGVGRILEAYPQWRGYYETIFTKGKAIGILNDGDIVSLLTTNCLIYIGAANAVAAITGQNR